MCNIKENNKVKICMVKRDKRMMKKAETLNNLCVKISLSPSDITAEGPSLNVLTFFGPRNEPITSPMPSDVRDLCDVRDIAAVGRNINIFSYDASPPKCRASELYVTPTSLVLCCKSEIAEIGLTLTSLAMTLYGQKI